LLLLPTLVADEQVLLPLPLAHVKPTEPPSSNA